MKKKLTQEYLKECLTYDPETGIFTWNTRPESHFKNSHFSKIWNTRLANRGAGCINKESGYLQIGINSKPYYYHRLVFLYMEGYLPENYVDHIDRNRTNNKWVNLREVSNKCNGQNCNLSKANTSGVCGVHWDKKSNKWVSRIKINFKTKHIGVFDNFDDAVMARYKEELDNPNWDCSVESTACKYLKERNLI